MPARRNKTKSPRQKSHGKPRRTPSARRTLSRKDREAGKWFEKLVALQARLRAPGGCPWDREQTHESLRKFLVEETYEVLDAMESGDAREFSGELGDLLLQVIFHSALAEEAGRFTITDVIESIHDKLIRRHPHVFGKVKAATSADVLKNWEQLKAAERAGEGKPAEAGNGAESILAGIPPSLPGVLEAYQLTRRASHIGFDWDDLQGILEKLEEEKHELLSALPASRRESQAESNSRLEEEVGDLLFAAVNIARFLGVDPEIALKKANQKFKQRFNWMEAAATREGSRLADLPRARMEELWNEAKSAKSAKAR
ncbi:MAG TPA: nucleoside triphosphate pyrophosphohydrolase [Candidatus Limnocylindria bacterium]|nr:nucleoside triphosphate pyrophosphohydrolase [Candidatus Limnocylindria bacterium]